MTEQHPSPSKEEVEKPYYEQPAHKWKHREDPVVVQAHTQDARGAGQSERSCLKAVCAALLCICCIRTCC